MEATTAPNPSFPIDAAPAASHGPQSVAAGAWWTVLVLFLLYVLSHIDRTIITMMVKPIKQDLGIGDFAMGLLLGPAFGLFFALCGLFMGMAIDRYSRRWVVYGGVTLWSISASICGLATSYVQLFVGRAGVGIGEATLSPAAYSLIADIVPRRRLALALSIFSSAVLVGSAIALIGGGFALQFLKQDGLIFGFAKPWQALFLITGVPGLLLAFLVFTIRDPRTGSFLMRQSAAGTQMERESFIAYLRPRKTLYWGIYGGVGLMVVNSYALLGWIPTYLMRHFGMATHEAGTAFGLVVVIAGGIGQIMSGIIVDAMAARGIDDAPLRYLAIAGAIMLPPSVAAFFVDTPVLFLFLIAFFFMLGMPMMGYAGAAIQIITPPMLRGRASAGLLLSVTLFGVLLGPPVTGALTDFVFRDPAKLNLSLAIGVAVFTPLSIWTLVRGMKPFREAVRY